MASLFQLIRLVCTVNRWQVNFQKAFRLSKPRRCPAISMYKRPTCVWCIVLCIERYGLVYKVHKTSWFLEPNERSHSRGENRAKWSLRFHRYGADHYPVMPRIVATILILSEIYKIRFEWIAHNILFTEMYYDIFLLHHSIRVFRELSWQQANNIKFTGRFFLVFFEYLRRRRYFQFDIRPIYVKSL